MSPPKQESPASAKCKASGKISNSLNSIPQYLRWGYSRIAAGTPEDPADIYQENKTLRRLLVEWNEQFWLQKSYHPLWR